MADIETFGLALRESPLAVLAEHRRCNPSAATDEIKIMTRTAHSPRLHQRARRARRRAPALLMLTSLLIVAPACADRRPTGTPGPAADELARQLLEAVNAPAWENTGAVRWGFRGDREHLWDRRRGLSRVRWHDVEVLVDLATRRGVAFDGGRRVEGERAEKLVAKAFARWTNDSFWLNPVVKVFDPGTERSLVQLDDGGTALLIEYTSGGLTPGDAYLWLPGPDGLPTEWRMWTSNLPKGGMRASWESWIELDTGALVSTRHKLALASVEIGEPAGAATLEELEPGPDPFAALLAGD